MKGKTTGASPGAVGLVPAERLQLPSGVDSNSPAHWSGEELVVFTSHPEFGAPMRLSGTDVSHLNRAEPVRFDHDINGYRWIEATWQDEHSGRLYAWYHNEPKGVCAGTHSPASVGELTAPRIGAAVSEDDGRTWLDFGLIMEGAADQIDCQARNGFFAGGHGDFCIVATPDFVYVLFGNYGGRVEEQGVAIARMAWSDRNDPAGKVWKWHGDRWESPGIGGLVTPIFPAMTAWQSEDCDAFWGPSVHWNTEINQYVMLLNRASGTGWVQEGIYVSFSREVEDPKSWSAPQQVFAGGSWYPQVIGTGPKDSDKRAGAGARVFIKGVSDHQLSFVDQH